MKILQEFLESNQLISEKSANNLDSFTLKINESVGPNDPVSIYLENESTVIDSLKEKFKNILREEIEKGTFQITGAWDTSFNDAWGKVFGNNSFIVFGVYLVPEQSDLCNLNFELENSEDSFTKVCPIEFNHAIKIFKKGTNSYNLENGTTKLPELYKNGAHIADQKQEMSKNKRGHRKNELESRNLPESLSEKNKKDKREEREERDCEELKKQLQQVKDELVIAKTKGQYSDSTSDEIENQK